MGGWNNKGMTRGDLAPNLTQLGKARATSCSGQAKSKQEGYLAASY